MASLEELLAEAQAADAPTIVAPSKVGVGGVDPLGLRQINFDLMDEVLPGLNNVASKLRPFILMAWAWRRVRFIIERDKLGGASDEDMRDFVDRIETIYAWSQFLLDPNAGIPGGQALRPLVVGPEDEYHFGGAEWIKRRNMRRSSTGLISPLNYGPGLRTMGWLEPSGPIGVFQPPPDLDPALDAFEAKFASALTHDAFNKLGAVTVARKDVEAWGKLWALGCQTKPEVQAGRQRFFGTSANEKRQAGFALIEAARESTDERDVAEIRAIMASSTLTGNLSSTALKWRRLQTRQLFRLALEAWLYWIIGQLDDGPLSTKDLASSFVVDAGSPSVATAQTWFSPTGADNPVALLNTLTDALRTGDNVPSGIREALAFCLHEARADEHASQPRDRLPLKRAVDEFEQWKILKPSACVGKMIEVWIMAQHAYWCVGRGLADARGRGKQILRLRVVMDDGGWTLTPGARQGNPPVATPDRLATALSLLKETEI